MNEMEPPPLAPDHSEQPSPKPVDLNTPGMILAIFGILGILMGMIAMVNLIASYLGYGQGYDEILSDPNFQELMGEYITVVEFIFGPYQIISTILGFLGSIVITIGGFKMKNASSYGWAMAGAAVAAFPCISSCCCLDVFVGAWALIVLTGEGTKDLFT